MKLVITGATGFIGMQLIPELLKTGNLITTIGRSKQYGSLVNEITLNEPNKIEFSQFPKGDVFIHLGGIADKGEKNAHDIFDQINNRWTVKMAEYAAQANYSKFLFLSSAKVHGDYTDRPITSTTQFNPNDHYAESKCQAELSLARIDTTMSIITLRPPAIYGTPLKGGNKKLVSTLAENKLIPFSTRENKRSFMGISNVISAIMHSIQHKEHINQAFVIHEYQTISTNDYIKQLALALNTKPKSLSIPNGVLAAIDNLARIAIKKEPLAALHRDFYIECDDFKNLFEWTPLHNTTTGLKTICKSTRTHFQ